MRQKTKVEHESDRRQLLRILVEVGFHPIAPDTLLGVMDESAHAISEDGLDFHLRFMVDKGWIEIGEEKVVGKAPRIIYAKLLAEGVEEYDRQCRAVVTLRRRI